MTESESDEQSEFVSLGTGSLSVLAGEVGQKILTLLGYVIVIRSLDVTGFGQLSLALILLQLGSTLSQSGLNGAIQHFIPKTEDGGTRRWIVYVTLGLTTGISLLTATTAFLFAEAFSVRVFGDPSIANPLRVFAVGLPFSVLFTTSIRIAQAFEDSRPHVYLRKLFYPVARILLLAGAVVVGAGPVLIAAAYTGTYVVSSIFAVAYLYRLVETLPPVTWRGLRITELVRFALPLFGTGATMSLVRRVDVIVLGVLAGSTSVALFQSVYTLSLNYLFVYSSIQFLFAPKFSRMVGEDGALASFFGRATRWALYPSLGVVTFVFTFAEPLLRLLFKPAYVSAAAELRLLGVASVVTAALGFNERALIGLGNSRIRLIASTALLATNAVLDILLVPLFGITGAVVGSVAGASLAQFIYAVKLYRTAGIHTLRTEILAPLGLTGLYAGTALWWGLPTMPVSVRSGLYALFVVSFLLLAWVVGGIEQRDITDAKTILTEAGSVVTRRLG